MRGDPAEEQQRNREHHDQETAQTDEEQPTAPPLAAWVGEAGGEQLVVAAVCLPANVEEIAQYRHGAEQHFYAPVRQHARQGHVRDAPCPRCEDDYTRRNATNDVTDAWNEADDAVEPESNGRARDSEPVVEQMRKQVECF